MGERPHRTADAATAATWAELRDRTSPPPFTDVVAELLAGRIDLSRPMLDVGAGSGHLVAALAARGAHVVTLDLSVPMLERLPAELRRVAGDAIALPVRGGGVGAVLAAHVLHVVPDWPAAVVELDRVAGPWGVVLVQATPSAGTPGPAARLRAVFREHLPPRALAGNAVADEPDRLDASFAQLGREATDLPEVRMPREETGRGLLRWLSGNLWTWPGPSTEAERARAAEAVVAWAAAEGIDLDEPFEAGSISRWRSYAHPVRNPEGSPEGP